MKNTLFYTKRTFNVIFHLHINQSLELYCAIPQKLCSKRTHAPCTCTWSEAPYRLSRWRGKVVGECSHNWRRDSLGGRRFWYGATQATFTTEVPHPMIRRLPGGDEVERNTERAAVLDIFHVHLGPGKLPLSVFFFLKGRRVLKWERVIFFSFCQIKPRESCWFSE